MLAFRRTVCNMTEGGASESERPTELQAGSG